MNMYNYILFIYLFINRFIYQNLTLISKEVSDQEKVSVINK